MFDNPVYKKLAHNDTGSARGHQGGVVIPKDLEGFFPDVKGIITEFTPTADVEIKAQLYHGSRFLTDCTTRYQYQTWGGTRSPERRLTSNLGPLRNIASENDIVLFERDLDDHAIMRITLIKIDDEQYSTIEKSIGTKRWGILLPHDSPISNRQIEQALQELELTGNKPFELLDNDRVLIQIKSNRKARSVAFRKLLLYAHGPICSVSGKTIVTPSGLNNLDAAHIVPVAQGGTDDPRNGLLMTKDNHWAFDRGIFFVDENLKVSVGKPVLDIVENKHLQALVKKNLSINTEKLEPHQSALKWHRENIAIR